MSIHHTATPSAIQHLQLVSSERKLSLQLFGPFCLRDELGQKINISAKKTRMLLAVVAFRGEVSRRELAGLLWSRHATEHALTSLRQALSKLKITVGAAWPQLLVVGRHSLKLHDAVACDLRALMNTAQLDEARAQKLSHICKSKLFEDLDHKDNVLNTWLTDARARFATHVQALIKKRITELGAAAELGNLASDAQVLARMYVVANTDTQPGTGAGMDELCEKYLQYLAEKVEYFWVNSVLKRSQRSAEAPPLTRISQVSAAECFSSSHNHPFQSRKTIVEAYGESRGSMLVLGESEAGRRALMLTLLVELLGQLEMHRHSPVPVVLNVAQWTGSGLFSWLQKEVAFRYDLPFDVVDKLFSAKRVSLLLEGIDELPPQLFGAFVHETNVLNHVQPGLGLSVFCRRESQREAKIKFKLNSAYTATSTFNRTLFSANAVAERVATE